MIAVVGAGARVRLIRARAGDARNGGVRTAWTITDLCGEGWFLTAAHNRRCFGSIPNSATNCQRSWWGHSTRLKSGGTAFDSSLWHHAALVVWELPRASNPMMGVRFTYAAPFPTIRASERTGLLNRVGLGRYQGGEPIRGRSVTAARRSPKPQASVQLVAPLPNSIRNSSGLGIGLQNRSPAFDSPPDLHGGRGELVNTAGCEPVMASSILVGHPNALVAQWQPNWQR
jgi:hypothetical protein